VNILIIVKDNRLLIAFTLVVFILISMVANSIDSSAADDLSVNSVIVKVGNEHVVIGMKDYGAAILGFNSSLYNYMISTNFHPDVKGIVIGDKLIDIGEYGSGVLSSKPNTVIYSESSNLAIANLTEFIVVINGEVSTKPYIPPTSTQEFKILSIE
jgi:phosphomannomutase